ncbi:MAG: choice-of-anchor R domain-containing protein, partial [Candidatus Binatia bacterium]
MKFSSPHASQSGQAALVAVIVIMSITLAIAFGMTVVSFNNRRVARNIVQSSQSYYLAEAGIEDSLLRIIDPDMSYSPSNSLTLGGQTATININESGNDITITAEGDVNSRVRTLSTSLSKTTTGASFFYGVQVDDGGLHMSNNSQVNGNVYSNGDIIGSNGARITGDASVAGGIDSTPQVESASQDTDQFFATTSGNRDIAQSFIATESGSVPQVSVYLGKIGNPGNNITLRITTDNNGKPDISSLASTTIADSLVPTTADWVTASFSSPPNVAIGTKYWIVLDYGSNSATNHWNWRQDSSDSYANNTGIYTNDWASGSAVWTNVGGDLAFRVWIGGQASRIEEIIIGDSSTGSGRANVFVNTSIHGSPCPNQYCLVENLPREELPIAPETIQNWKQEAAAGGTHTGDYVLSNGGVDSLGPTEITGDLALSNGATLTLTGTVWVHGNVQLSNNCIITLDAGYGENSGILLTDGTVQISNNCVFSGSGHVN